MPYFWLGTLAILIFLLGQQGMRREFAQMANWADHVWRLRVYMPRQFRLTHLLVVTFTVAVVCGLAIQIAGCRPAFDRLVDAAWSTSAETPPGESLGDD